MTQYQKGNIPWMTGRHHGPEALLKMSLKSKGHKNNLGRVQSAETRRKIGDAARGRIQSEATRMRKRAYMLTQPNRFPYRIGYKHSEETRRKIALANTGNKYNLGRKLTIQTRLRISQAHITRQIKLGKTAYITPIYRRIRRSLPYTLWREAVLKRDNFTCVLCGAHGWNKLTKSPTKLHADHIKPFAFYPEFRFDINNGRTLCVPCHKKTDTWGRRFKHATLSESRRISSS